ncbi:hypothetical protein UY3_08746 [Chelonia mydas]|uniref:Uncharacterized protein n=1 Tax=Chelonia mydas TaxID=8469 RepID=M7BEU1_CHEMY|nr:hypothetical protein UY3_08746 [Chelonia mydas]
MREDRSKLCSFSYVNNVAEVVVLRSTYGGVHTTRCRLETLSRRLPLRFKWKTGVAGRATGSRFSGSIDRGCIAFNGGRKTFVVEEEEKKEEEASLSGVLNGGRGADAIDDDDAGDCLLDTLRGGRGPLVMDDDGTSLLGGSPILQGAVYVQSPLKPVRVEGVQHLAVLDVRWSTGVNGRAICGRFSRSSLDPLNRPPMYRSPCVNPPPTGKDSWMSFTHTLHQCLAKLFRLGPKHRIWSLGDKSAHRSIQQISADILGSLDAQNASKRAAMMALNLVDLLPGGSLIWRSWDSREQPLMVSTMGRREPAQLRAAAGLGWCAKGIFVSLSPAVRSATHP